MSSVHENRLNVLLSETLNEIVIISRSEQIRREGREDVVIYYQGLRLVLEGSCSRIFLKKNIILCLHVKKSPIDTRIFILIFILSPF